MKVGIVGVGAVGAACAKAMLIRGSCSEIVLVDKDPLRARGVAMDLSHCAVLCPPAVVRDGTWKDLRSSAVVVVTAGINEKAGAAIDRSDVLGRLRLLPTNAKIYREVVPLVAENAARAIVLVVTDPPDPLADVARSLTSTNVVLSSGTFLDSLRFQVQVAKRFGCHPSSVQAMVIGEHGTSQVYVWSQVRLGGVRVLDTVGRDAAAKFQSSVENAVRHANIDIIDGTGASQHGIGVATTRIVEAILRDEGLIAPIGSYHAKYRVTLSLPCIIGKGGIRKIVSLDLTERESRLLDASASAIRQASKLARVFPPKPRRG